MRVCVCFFDIFSGNGEWKGGRVRLPLQRWAFDCKEAQPGRPHAFRLASTHHVHYPTTRFARAHRVLVKSISSKRDFVPPLGGSCSPGRLHQSWRYSGTPSQQNVWWLLYPCPNQRKIYGVFIYEFALANRIGSPPVQLYLNVFLHFRVHSSVVSNTWINHFLFLPNCFARLKEGYDAMSGALSSPYPLTPFLFQTNFGWVCWDSKSRRRFELENCSRAFWWSRSDRAKYTECESGSSLNILWAGVSPTSWIFFTVFTLVSILFVLPAYAGPFSSWITHTLSNTVAGVALVLYPIPSFLNTLLIPPVYDWTTLARWPERTSCVV